MQLRPKMLKKIKQDRLAAREHLRALGQTLSILGLELQLPEHNLRPLNLEIREQRLFTNGSAYLWSAETGSAHWDTVRPASGSELRLTLQPDEGSPMFCTCQFLQAKGFRILFCRDELLPVCISTLPVLIKVSILQTKCFQGTNCRTTS